MRLLKAQSKTLVEEKKIEVTISNIRGESFTVLDFMKTFRGIYPEVREKLVNKFGVFGVGRIHRNNIPRARVKCLR